ncbi:hypothetical protein DL96DRAFT_1580672 [Flagelloscypha sp. PMI_526]|nr:hypothetical protein DL96DRAFT_1580672 [Flagelloscypha sp. PMI_526]
MTSLPLDLLPHLLSSLDARDLEICSFVTWDFHHIARQLLFSQLTLCSKTWRAKCDFLLKDPESQLLKHTKSLTFLTQDMPIFTQNNEVPSLLISLLQKFQGHRIKRFCIDSLSQEHAWSDLHTAFQNAITASVLPSILSLQLLGVTRIPLLTVLGQCPSAANISFSAESDYVGTYVDTRKTELSRDSNVTSLSVGIFGESDFSTTRTLAQYILLGGSKIISLELDQYCAPSHFPKSFPFLEPFEALTQRLLHLSLGPQIYTIVVAEHGKSSPLALKMFPQLQTLQLSLLTEDNNDSSENWTSWSEWIARMFEFNSKYPRSLKILRFLLHPGCERRQRTVLDDVAAVSNFQIHICVDGHGNNAERFEDTVSSIRSSLESWDANGKLKFWLRL